MIKKGTIPSLPNPLEVFQLAPHHFIKLEIFIGINKNKNYNLKKKIQ